MERGTENQTSKVVKLSQLTDANKSGSICVRITAIGDAQTSRNGWRYRKLGVEDNSMSAEALISEEKYQDWKFKKGDYCICHVRSNGVGNDGRLAVFYNDFLGPFETAKIVFELRTDLYEIKMKSGEHMKSNETVYQISAREAKSLLELIKLWIVERKPQHYTKWCQMHQIVATNLYYMSLVKRTASMSGLYYPTEEALEFFEGKKRIPKKRVFMRDKNGRHQAVSDEGENKTFLEYLSDHADMESSLREYDEALKSYKESFKAD